jgi:lysophospholipase L1-like esterase
MKILSLLCCLSTAAFAQLSINTNSNGTHHIIIEGDSHTACYRADTGACGPPSSGSGPIGSGARWADLLQSWLEVSGHGGGRGFTGVSVSLGGSLNSDFWSTSAALTEVPNMFGPWQTGYGVNGAAMLSFPAGSALNFNAHTTYDTLKVWCGNRRGANATGWLITIDGNTVPGSACLQGGYQGTGAADIVPIRTSMGEHSVTLTCASGGAGPCYLAGASAERSSGGVVVDNFALGGFVADGFSDETKRGFINLKQSGSHDVMIIFLGTNDALNGVSVAQYGSNLYGIIQNAKWWGASVLVIAPPRIGNRDVDARIPDYIAEASRQASYQGASFMDFSDLGSFQQANADGVYGADGIHMTNQANMWLFSKISNLISLK